MSLWSKWEGRAVIPSGNWTCALTDGTGGPYTITLTAANTYYHSSPGNDTVDLPAKLKALFEAAGGGVRTYTVTCSAGESGTGKYTIAVDSGTFSITWTSTDLRDLLGFTGNISAQTTSTGSNHAQGLWLPECPVETPYGLASSGMPMSTAVVSLSEDGTYSVTHGAKHTRNEYVYGLVALSKVVAASESTTNESYETFWLDTIRGEEPWANAGRQVRYYADTDVDGTYITFNVLNVARPDIARASPDWDGFWTVRLEVAVN